MIGRGGPVVRPGGGRPTADAIGEPALAPPRPAPAPPQPPTSVASAMTTGRVPTEPAPRAGVPKAGGQGPVLSGMEGWLGTTHLCYTARTSVRGILVRGDLNSVACQITKTHHDEASKRAG
jgi:hypothetical protein